MEVLILFLFVLVYLLISMPGNVQRYSQRHTNKKKEHIYSDAFLRAVLPRKTYYRDVYLKSDAWKRKRYVVLRRDNWQCVYCGNRATQVHHKRYAKVNIGKEPIEWLESVCNTCHDELHP
ncbi:MAG TPA: hypothetical protein PKY29_01840 [Ferruginibacter sp.]|nr:hypothetical protein [Ferruginibacter sp.]HRO17934.1 hypothetical protein [Ferruginibacter sp.]HRQ20023.1 hypothetical protein [Ferruginibacter sp.]